MSGDRRRRSTARALSLTISEMLPLVFLSRARAHARALGFLPPLVDSWSTLSKESNPSIRNKHQSVVIMFRSSRLRRVKVRVSDLVTNPEVYFRFSK
jgi:hypothetical protein